MSLPPPKFFLDLPLLYAMRFVGNYVAKYYIYAFFILTATVSITVCSISCTYFTDSDTQQ